MPPPERRPQDLGEAKPPSPARDRAAARVRPAPTSALAPSPSPLMPVPDPRSPSGPAGRRQHRRAGPPAEELVYLSGRVPRPLRDELHIRAIGEGRPVVELLRDAIRGYLDQPGGS